MRKVSSYKCPVCKMEYKTLGGWSEHMHRHHPDEIPKGFTDLQYFYYTITGKKSGSCVQCHKPTDWNEATGKYNRYCNNPKCKEQYCKVAKKRMIDKYGKIHLLNDPEMQRKMLSNRKIAGTYTFSDGSGKVPYVASYEKDFLMTMDTVLGLKATDIMSPSPHNYVYMYEGKPHFYIPDFYIPSLNLEIEIKDDQNGPNANKHPKIAAVDRVKEALKDETMAKNKSVNYFKVMDKSYTDFFTYVLELKECIDDDLKNTIISAMAIESVNDPENSFEMALERALEYDDDEEFNGEGDYGFEVVSEASTLYHGSNTKVSSITPHVSTHGKSWVYATADHDFALCYSGKQWDDLNINQAYHNGQLTLTEIEKGAFDKYFNCPGYIYSFPGDNFKEFNRHELVSDKEVVLGDNSVEYVPNVMDAIKKSGIKLYRYPNLPPYIKNREEYIRKKKELFANVSTLESTDEIYDEVEPVMEDSSKPYMPYHEYRQKLGLNSNRPISGGEYSDRMAKIRDEQLQKMQRQREKEREKQREKWREEAREKERANHTAEPNNDILYFSSPKELHTWMKNNISYANFTKLISPEEMLAKKRGSCHDQALFAYKYLKRMGLKPKLLFFIAYKEGEVVGGMTHTLCYYEQDNKVWWFETAWNGAIGLRSYPTENAMRVDIFRRYMNLPDSKKFPELEFKEITPMNPGCNLSQYVDKALEVALTADERTDFGIPSLKKYPMPDPDHVKAAIRMFNHVDEEHEKELANNIIKYIKKYKMTDINVGKDNRFHKYYGPSEDAVITDVASQVPYGGAVIQRPMN